MGSTTIDPNTEQNGFKEAEKKGRQRGGLAVCDTVRKEKHETVYRARSRTI